MRIGLLAPELTEAHGWGRYTIDLAHALHAQGDISFVIATSSSSPNAGGIPNEGYHPILPSLVPAKRGILPRSLLTVPRLRRIFADCDVIHATAEHYLPAAAMIAGNRPLFVTAHGTYLPMSVQRRVGPVYRWAARRAEILAVSGYTTRQIAKVLPDSTVHTIHNGVHVTRFSTPPEKLPAKAGPTILGVGVNKARKGYHVLLAALPAVRAVVPDVQYIIIGDDSDQVYQKMLNTMIAERDLHDVVHILGRVPEEELFGWYHQADVFAMPAINVGGKFEGFGLTYLEAGAAGLPVIGTWDCGAEDAIVDGETGFLVPQYDAAALSGALIQLLTDGALRRRTGAAGRIRADEHSWTHIAQAVRRVYDGGD